MWNHLYPICLFFYFGILANLTPPVALAAFAGAGISGGDPNRTGFISLKLAAAGILVPYIFVYSPELLLQGTSAGSVIWLSVTAITGVIMLGASLEGYLLTKMNPFLRILALSGAITLVIPGGLTDIIGISMLIVVLISQLLQRKRTVKTA